MDVTFAVVALVALLLAAAAGAVSAILTTRPATARRIESAEQDAADARAAAEDATRRAHEAQVARAEAMGQRDAALDRARAADEAAQRAGALTSALGPLAERLDLIGRAVTEIERDRSATAGRLAEQLRTVQQLGEGLREQTASLAGALRSSNARGTWGEVQLRRIVEAAGMLPRVDFDVQATLTGLDGTQRPDMVVRLPEGRGLVVDAKAPLVLADAEAAGSGVDPREHAGEQARRLRGHVGALAQKRYWAGLPASPEFVVCFLPAESILATALSVDSALIEDAMTQQVLLATPTTLLALLRTVALTWREQAVHENAQEVLRLGRDLYGRLGTVAEHADKLGRTLDGAVRDYNRFVGSFEGRLLVTARRMGDLGLDGAATTPRLVEADPRGFTAPELTAADPGAAGDEFDLFVETAGRPPASGGAAHVA